MAMNVDYKGLELGDQSALTSITLVPGRAVAKESTGVRPPSAANIRVLGLVKEALISGVVNEVTGDNGIYGSGKASVLSLGVATVQQSVYNGTSYSVYDEAQTYTVGQLIYATVTTGVLTNQQPSGTGPSGLTSLRVGRVLTAPSNPANGDPMQITVECMS